MWGLTFKSRTDDLRDSPSLAIIRRLLDAGAIVQAHDPTVAGAKPGVPAGITIADSPYAACNGAQVLAVLTEWDEFRWLDIDRGEERHDRPRGRRCPQPPGAQRLASSRFRSPRNWSLST